LLSILGLPVYEASRLLDQRPGYENGAAREMGYHSSSTGYLLDVRVHLPHWLLDRNIAGKMSLSGSAV